VSAAWAAARIVSSERGAVMKTRSMSAAWLLCLVMLVAGATATGVAGAVDEDSLVVTALTGPQGGHITISVPDDAGVAVFPQVHVKLIAPAGSETPQRILNLTNVPAEHGSATVAVTELERGTAVVVQAHVREQAPPRTVIHRGTTMAKLRPDLVVAAVYAPPQTLSTSAFDVVADVTELNTDVGATATATLMLGPTPLAEPKQLTVAAGATTSVTFAGVVLTTPVTADLTVRITGADPYETDDTNNAGTGTIEVTEHELERSTVFVQSLGGYGAQFNQHVYAAVTPKPPGSLPDLEAKVRDLEPQLVRVFFHEVQERDADQLASFYETVELAQESGAAINITYHTAGNARLNPGPYMRDFAIVLQNLVTTKGLTNVRWVTIQNEPNTTNVTKEQYEALYRALDGELVARGLRDHIGLMGGDLVESSAIAGSNHLFWFEYMAEHMNDVLDAYSVHIYWNYWDIPRMEFRLRSVRDIVTSKLPPEARKPVFVTEFGVRGIQNLPGLPAIQPGYWADGTPLSRTNIAAFQHLWFDLVSAQLGFSGAVKWDAYWGRYTAGYREVYNLIGPAEEGWPLFPAYHALRLLFQTTHSGWQVVQVSPWEQDDWRLFDDAGQRIVDQPEKEIAAYTGPNGELTLMGLDTHGRGLNATSEETPEYSIGELPALTEFNLAIWNATGNGEAIDAGSVTTNAVGVARFQVPLHAAFALTTVPVS
jgi:hypothetical protein